MRDYLVYMAQIHPKFRKAELECLAGMYGIQVDMSDHNDDSPFMVVQLESDKQAKQLIDRSVLSKAIYELWGQGKTMDELHEDVKSKYQGLRDPYMESTFKFELLEYQGTGKPKTEQVKMFDSFRYLGFNGKVRMKGAEQIYTILRTYSIQDDLRPCADPDYCWLGRLVGESARSRGVLDRYEIPKRPYYGTTTFEAELSLATCNIAQVRPGQFVYDPFVGTGSFILAAGYYGAYTYGSDIDFLTLKGGRPGKVHKRIKDDFQYYGTQTQFGDVLCMDFTNNALRSNLQIDTIVCDPPYGIREGLRVCGTLDEESKLKTQNVMIDGQKAYLRREYIPPKKPISLDLMLDDLLQFAADRLPIGGRLAFWMPVTNDQDIPTLIPQHRRLEKIYELDQAFNQWARRLLVYVKRGEDYEGKTMTVQERAQANDFLERYMHRFDDRQ